MNRPYLQIKFANGTHIDNAAKECVRLAAQFGMGVVFEFNNCNVFVEISDTEIRVADKYFKTNTNPHAMPIKVV